MNAKTSSLYGCFMAAYDELIVFDVFLSSLLWEIWEICCIA